MKLEYTVLATGKRKTVTAKITTKHSASSHGMPVIVLPDGDALDYNSAILLNYRIVSATPKELALLDQWRRGMPPLG